MIQRRNLFFTGEHQYLRFSENSPEIKECEHDVCNCTKAVTKRPDGEPHQKQQYIYLKEKSKYYDCEVMLASGGVAAMRPMGVSRWTISRWTISETRLDSAYSLLVSR